MQWDGVDGQDGGLAGFTTNQFAAEFSGPLKDSFGEDCTDSGYCAASRSACAFIVAMDCCHQNSPFNINRPIKRKVSMTQSGTSGGDNGSGHVTAESGDLAQVMSKRCPSKLEQLRALHKQIKKDAVGRQGYFATCQPPEPKPFKKRRRVAAESSPTNKQ